jgi:hypothetical protein
MFDIIHLLYYNILIIHNIDVVQIDVHDVMIITEDPCPYFNIQYVENVLSSYLSFNFFIFLNSKFQIETRFVATYTLKFHMEFYYVNIMLY